jgi:hypothetical protein
MNGPRKVVVKKETGQRIQTAFRHRSFDKVEVEDERAPEGPAVTRLADVL